MPELFLWVESDLIPGSGVVVYNNFPLQIMVLSMLFPVMMSRLPFFLFIL